MTVTPNRLAHETSLYLRQHANNPVDWYPWGQEAIERARQLDRPIFLSVGYSACHWCHVMEHESFEDPAIAQILNDHYVSIKVDREERPDIDTIYMTAHQIMNRGGGGWPLSVFLTPELRPFYTGTYFPPDERYAAQGMPSFRRLLLALVEAWQNKRSDIDQQAGQVTDYLQQITQLEAGDTKLSPHLLQGALSTLRQAFDTVHGGFGGAPKFPHAIELRLLLRIAQRFDAELASDMVAVTLNKMADGGIYDQLGGGFHRYSVDARWLVPHFEKMLYDNALMTQAYLDAYQLTGQERFCRMVTETLDYVLREMTSPSGAFYSTQDADSEGEEGKFYVWSKQEIESILGPDLAKVFNYAYGVTEGGNFEGHNILHRTKTDEQDARVQGLSVEAFRQQLTEAQTKLLAVRSQRVWPGRDEKILTAWNALMIPAFARAGRALDEPRYTQAASSAAEFVLKHLCTPDHRLFRTCGENSPAKLNGYLEDYAFLVDALITLYETTQMPRWLEPAVLLAETMLAQFADLDGGGFFYTPSDHEELITRTKDMHDGSTPSGNAMAATAFARLAVLTGRSDFRAAVERTLNAFGESMEQSPAAHAQMLIALDLFLGPVREYVLVGPSQAAQTQEVLSKLTRRYAPNAIIAFHDPAQGEPPALVQELFQNRTAVDGQVTLYICENRVCQEPLVGDAVLSKLSEPKT